MTKWIPKLSVMCFLGLGMATLPESQAQTTPAPAAKKGNTQQVDFEDLLVQGKYHFSDEAVTTVEQDKILDSLLQVRKDFQDRIRQSAKQE